jgi:hypothetical protein
MKRAPNNVPAPTEPIDDLWEPLPPRSQRFAMALCLVSSVLVCVVIGLLVFYTP